MNRRRLGNTTLEVSQLSFGCAALGSRTAKRDSKAAVARALELGINFFDTAPFYGQGESEKILGEVFAGRREQVIIATKIGLYPSAVLRLASKVRPLVRSALVALPGVGRKLVQRSVQGFMRSSNQVKFDPQSIVTSVEASLKRLRTDHIDLLLLHVTPPREERPQVVEQLRKLQSQGKIRYYGASSHSADDVRFWLGSDGGNIAALQIMLNLLEVPAIDLSVSLAAQSGVGLIAREPFARGRLLPPAANGKLGFVGHEYDAARFEAFARERGRTVPQIALQFLAGATGVETILAGMSTQTHLEENVKVLSLPPLSSAELTQLRDHALR
jgi:aryl-alcohol dehydrogenase-like predicted oxidoreductase